MTARKIILTISENVTDVQAMSAVLQVIKAGKISSAKVGGKQVGHYCWVTAFEGLVVSTRRKDHSQSPESFHVEAN